MFTWEWAQTSETHFASGWPTVQDVKNISSRVEQELEQISDSKVVNRIRELLVTPHSVERAWDYGARGEHFVCSDCSGAPPLEHGHRILLAGVRSFLSMGARLFVGLAHEHCNGLFLVRVSCGGDAK